MVVGDLDTFSSAATLESDAPVVYGSEQASNCSDLPKSVLDYYVNIEKVLESESFENDSERALLEEKLIDQIKTDGMIRILYHWDCSRVVERLLVNCTHETLVEVGKLLLPHISDIACHSFASHVLEIYIMKLVRDIYTKGADELVELAEQVFRKLCIHVSDLVSNTHGSYTLRLALQVLVGVRIEDERKQRKRWEIGKNSFYETSQTHPVLKKILHKFTKRLVKEDAGTLLWSDQGAPLLSVILILLQRTDNKSLPKLKSVILSSFDRKVTDYKEVEKFGPLPEVLLDRKASYVIQSLIKVCTKDELVSLYSDHFQTILVPLCLHPVSNYTVQTLLQHAPSRDIADKMCSQIVPIFEDLLAESVTGVVISVIKCCHHHSLTSYNIMKVLQDAFHVPDDQLHIFFRCLMSLTTHDVLLEKLESYKKPTQSGKPRRDRFEATLPGSLLLQGLFKLGEVDLLEEGICTLSEDHMFYLSTNPQSSHAIQAFLTSLTIPSTIKHKLIKNGVSVVDRLVTTPSGSRIVEAMWNSADIDIKSAIAQVLVEKEQAITDNTYGSIVWRNCNLKAFKMGTSTWEESERKKRKKIETLEKIISEVDTKRRKTVDVTPETISTEKSENASVANVPETQHKVKKSKKLKNKQVSEG